MTPEEYEAAAEKKMEAARGFINKMGPYYAHTIYGFIPVAVPGLKTMGVTAGMVLYHDPQWVVDVCTMESLAGTLVHESEHVVRNHVERGDEMLGADRKNPELQSLANKAMDFPINANIMAADWKLPHFVTAEMYDLPEGLSSEQYYDLLKKQPNKPPPTPKAGAGQGKKDQKQDDQKGQGQGGQPPPPGGDGDESPPKGSAQQPSKQPGSEPCGPGTGCCGGIAGNPLPGDLEKDLDEKFGRSSYDVKSIAKATISAMEEYEAQHGRGSIPGHLSQVIEKSKEKSKIPWQREIAHILKKASGRLEAGGSDFSLARPSKRSAARGFPRPGLVAYVPEVAFVVDTSGSMGTVQIIACFVQVIAILRTLGIDEAYLLQADVAVANSRKIRLRDLLKTVKIEGRGGTDFDAALRAVAKLKPRPDLVVYLTDGDGSITYRPPGMEVIWCIVPGPWSKPPDVKWGHIVMIGADGKKRRKKAA